MKEHLSVTATLLNLETENVDVVLQGKISGFLLAHILYSCLRILVSNKEKMLNGGENEIIPPAIKLMELIMPKNLNTDTDTNTNMH